jgi:predicted RNA-binding Zn ribbon-like protein
MPLPAKMVTAMSARVNDELSFRFVAGARALDLLSTLGNRYSDPVERLREPADLDRWLAASGFSLSARATSRDLTDARSLREVLNRTTRALLADSPPQAGDLDELNRWARGDALAPQLDPAGQMKWTSGRPVRASLVLIAREAVALLSSAERELIRECAAAPNCSLLYLDRSRGRNRRWCEMDRCGSRAKMSDYRDRQRSAS